MAYKVFHKKYANISAGAIKFQIRPDQQSAEILHKSINKTFKKLRNIHPLRTEAAVLI